MRRLIAVLSVAAVIGAVVIPAVAQERPDPVGAIIEFFNSKTGQEYASQFTSGSGNSSVTDPADDFEHSTGDDPGFTPPHIDISEAWSLNLDDGGVGFFGPTDQNTYWNPDGGPLHVDLPSGQMLYTLQGEQPQDGSQFDNGAVLFGMFLADTPPVVPQARCEYVVWLYTGGISGTFQNHPNFPRDPAQGTNLALGMGLNPEGDFPSGMFALRLNKGGGFTYDPGVDLRGFISDRYVGIIAPSDLVSSIHGINFYAFCSSTGSYASGESGADQTGLLDLTADQFGQLAFTVAPEATTTTEPEPTSSTAPPSTSGGEGEPSGGASDEPGSETEDGSPLPLILILIGLLLVGGGYYLYTRTRERTPGGAVTTTTPHHANCDWALYFNDGGARVNLRPAKGHECCVYDIDVQTIVSTFEIAAKGRQDDDNPQGEDISPDERLRMFDTDGYSSGTDAGGFAATRTGPSGRQDWMQGLGDPRYEAGWLSTDEGRQHVQQRPLEETVDAGLSVRYEAQTEVKAKLTPGCSDYENEYSLGSDSKVSAWATSECTNGEPGRECPVELTAAGMLDASASGDLEYELQLKALSYPDELEPKAVNAPDGPVGGVDSHDHASRPRDDWEDSKTDGGTATIDADTTSVKLNSVIHLDSAQIVPMEVWDTTDRVSTEVGGDLDHLLDVRGSMTVGAEDNCGTEGHGTCMCAPKFSLSIGGGRGTLEVDGKNHKIEAPWPDGVWRLA